MDSIVRKPFQGVTNIVRFNWHFYILAALLMTTLIATSSLLPLHLNWAFKIIACLIYITTLSSLFTSYYVYDFSGLYTLQWVKEMRIRDDACIVTINAGFDETTAALVTNYPQAHISVFDFYNPEKHTEISIERARKAYAPHPAAQQIKTDHIPIQKGTADLALNIFSLHEIRDQKERIDFLKEQYKILKDDGACIVVEHLRNIPNFMAYNIGFFHFFSPGEWHFNFSKAGFIIEKTKKITPFVTIYILKKSYGDTP